jgi:hypothetical protein
MILIKEKPASSTVISILVEPASIEFSMSSLSTDAGRSITSPAAIFSTTEGGNTSTVRSMVILCKKILRLEL